MNRWWMVGLAVALLASACTGSDEDAFPPISVEETLSTTTTTRPTTTTSSSITSSTLSERAQAEVDIEQLVIDWYLAPIDTSKGEEELGLEYLTGLLERRTRDYSVQLAANGQVLRSRGLKRIEVMSVLLNNDLQSAEVRFCGGSGEELLDEETLERVGEPVDPDYLTITRLNVEITDGGWLVSEMYPSLLTGDPELCDLVGS